MRRIRHGFRHAQSETCETIVSGEVSSVSSHMATTIDPRRSSAALRVANDELATIREAMRELNRMVGALERGELDKVVLTQRNQMRAVLVSLERYSELERQARPGV